MSGEPWGGSDSHPQRVLDRLLAWLTAKSAYNIGFPAATDLDLTPLAPFLRFVLNNVNDPLEAGRYPMHTKGPEIEVCEAVAGLLGAPADDWWGYVTSGATEGNEHGLHLARERYPTGLVYVSAAAHPTIGAILGRLRMDHIVIRALESGEVDYDDLAAEVWHRRHRPAIVVACVGTPLTEAVDDVARISARLDEVGVPSTRRWIHADAALSGIPLALLDDGRRPAFDFSAGTRSMIVSGHKFFGIPLPCGIYLMRDSDRPYPLRAATYTGSPDHTWSNSRSGFAALCLWYLLRHYGFDRLRERADLARELAGYTHQRLIDIGWPAWRPNPHGFTVVLQTPPPAVLATWPLPEHGPVSHIICMPGLTSDRIDAFLADLEASRAGTGGTAGASRAGTDRPDGAPVDRHRPLTVLARLSRSRRFHQPTT